MTSATRVIEGHATEIRPHSPSGIALAVRGWLAALGILEPDDTERVLWPGLLMLAAGMFLVAPPLALIVPGAILTAIALGFRFGPRPPIEES